jgi:hypothetical protein
MHTIKSAVAIGLTALLLSTSLAGAVSTLPPTGPVTTPTIPIVDPGNNKPTPEFDSTDMLADSGVLVVSPYNSSCAYTHDDLQGRSIVEFVNLGTETIPAGSIYVVTWPDGTTESFKTPWDIAPGGSFGVHGPANADQPGFHCSVHVRVKTKLGPDNPTLGH